MMQKLTYVLAILAALSTAAVAGEIKQKEATATAITATQMSDAEMDQVTAGVAYVTVYDPAHFYVLIYNNGQAPPLVVYPDSTRSVVCVNSCFN
jgi:hypothetical protein